MVLITILIYVFLFFSHMRLLCSNLAAPPHNIRCRIYLFNYHLDDGGGGGGDYTTVKCCSKQHTLVISCSRKKKKIIFLDFMSISGSMGFFIISNFSQMFSFWVEKKIILFFSSCR